MPLFCKRPVVVEAFRLTELAFQAGPPDWLKAALNAGFVYCQGGERPYLTIATPEGAMRADEGDWIIRGVNGELYPCKPDIFEQTYEAVP